AEETDHKINVAQDEVVLPKQSSSPTQGTPSKGRPTAPEPEEFVWLKEAVVLRRVDHLIDIVLNPKPVSKKKKKHHEAQMLPNNSSSPMAASNSTNDRVNNQHAEDDDSEVGPNEHDIYRTPPRDPIPDSPIKKRKGRGPAKEKRSKGINSGKHSSPLVTISKERSGERNDDPASAKSGLKLMIKLKMPTTSSSSATSKTTDSKKNATPVPKRRDDGDNDEATSSGSDTDKMIHKASKQVEYLQRKINERKQHRTGSPNVSGGGGGGGGGGGSLTKARTGFGGTNTLLRLRVNLVQCTRPSVVVPDQCLYPHLLSRPEDPEVYHQGPRPQVLQDPQDPLRGPVPSHHQGHTLIEVEEEAKMLSIEKKQARNDLEHHRIQDQDPDQIRDLDLEQGPGQDIAHDHHLDHDHDHALALDRGHGQGRSQDLGPTLDRRLVQGSDHAHDHDHQLEDMKRIHGDLRHPRDTDLHIQILLHQCRHDLYNTTSQVAHPKVMSRANMLVALIHI
ncbi:hypothetical protein BGZ76_006168, partial [Entomortierella beljakovae]